MVGISGSRPLRAFTLLRGGLQNAEKLFRQCKVQDLENAEKLFRQCKVQDLRS